MTEEKYISTTEVCELLEADAKKRELSYEQKLALQHAKLFSFLKPAEVKKLVAELRKLEFVSEQNAYKIVDIMPDHPDEVRLIFAKERFTLDTEQVNRILEIVRKYL